MKVASRMPLVLAFLIGIFVAGTVLGAVVLASYGDPTVALMGVIAAVACLVAAALAWLVLRSIAEQASLELPPPELQAPAPVRARGPLRVQALPTAELPPAYLTAVMKGLEANRAAMKARETYHGARER